MQRNVDSKKQLIKEALAKTLREYRADISLFKFCSENDLPISIISEAERAKKDPQLTTIFKIAEAYSVTPEKFVADIRKNLPEDFFMIEN